MQSLYYKVYRCTYLHPDQYGKHIFKIIKDVKIIAELEEKINKYGTVNPICRKDNKSDYYVKFNNSTHILKSRVNYDIIFFIHKNQNPKTKKYYINLHISDVKPSKTKKPLSKISIKDV